MPPKKYQKKKNFKKFKKRFRKQFGKKAYKSQKKLINKVLMSKVEKMRVFGHCSLNNPSLIPADIDYIDLSILSQFQTQWCLDLGWDNRRRIESAGGLGYAAPSTNIHYVSDKLTYANTMNYRDPQWFLDNPVIYQLKGCEYERRSLVMDIVVRMASRSVTSNTPSTPMLWGPERQIVYQQTGNGGVTTNIASSPGFRYEFIVYQSAFDLDDDPAYLKMCDMSVLPIGTTYPQNYVHVIHRESGKLSATNVTAQHKIVLKGKYFRKKIELPVQADTNQNSQFAKKGKIYMRMLYDVNMVPYVNTTPPASNFMYPAVSQFTYQWKVLDIN